MVRQLIGRYKDKLMGNSFGQNVLIMFLGTAVGQLGSVILAPALTRIYSPEEFGVLGSYTAIITIASVVAALRYEMALPLARTTDEVVNLLAVCGAALLFTTVMSGLLLLALSPNVLNVTDFGSLRDHWFVLPIGFMCIGAYQIMVYYATQQGAFKMIARTKIYQGYAGPLIQLVLGTFGMGAWGLVTGFIVGQSTGSGFLLSRLVFKTGAARGRVSLSAMKSLAKRYIRFPLVSSWSGLINAAGTSTLLLIVIPAMYSTTIAGYVFLIDRVVGRPMLMISTSVLQVYMGDVSKSLASDPSAVKRRFLRLAGQQLGIVSVWLLLVNLIAPFAFPIFFGREWLDAVPYLRVLSLALLPQMVMHSLIHTLQLLEKQGLSAVWEMGRLIAVIGAFVVAHLLDLDAIGALLLYSFAQGGAQLILFGLMLRSIDGLQKGSSDAPAA